MPTKSKSATAKARVATDDDYFALVHRCPLRVIRTAAEYGAAVDLYKSLVARSDAPGLSSGESDYADVLSRLIRDYDEKHSSLKIAKLPPIEALKHLMAEHGMNTVSLGRLVGGSGQASLILRGKRGLSKANIQTLAARFSVSPALFL